MCKKSILHSSFFYVTVIADLLPVVTDNLQGSISSMVRVLGTNTFLLSSEYYDEKGRHIQTIEDNIKMGRDVTTLQYHWDGRLMSSHTKHTTANSGYTNFGILTKNIFDKIGRVTSIQKKFGSNAFESVASYDFDDMGRLKTKHLDPGYTGIAGKNELESLTYSYNIHNNITGINKDYALKTAGKYDKWGNFFGLYLGYDNRDNVFVNKQLDGHVTGQLWNTQGDDAQRKYDYTYDNAGRLNSAAFKERQTTGDTWDNTRMDFSVSGSSGKITYDYNGNLQSLLQKGVLPGNTTPVTVDNLTYTYTAYSNKLLTVTDNGTLGSANGSLGDFKDARSSDMDHDYEYDDNGNLVIDQNKNPVSPVGRNVKDVSYNFLDKPEVLVATKGTIKIVYDADGNKLQKMYTPKDGTPAVTTTYINGYVYKGDELQYINFEEGRIRVIKPVSVSNGLDGLTIAGNITLPVSPSGAGGAGVYDYFIRDYQENVRMILTEEIHNGTNQCTMETARATSEEPVFGQTGSANEVATTRITKPTGWTSNTSSSVSKLSKLTGHTVGPNSLLKVMAGDVLNAKTDYYYQGTVTNNSNSLVTDVVNTLAMAISGSSAASSTVKGGVPGISTNLNGSVPFASAADPDKTTTDNIPRAYLNIMFFDERFNFVPENSTAVRVSQSGSGAAPLVLPANIKAPKNGYAYIYVSNENDQAIYFDNLQVVHNRGRIIEEDHYYAFGLKIAGISSNKLGNDTYEGYLQNKNLYNDKELIDEADLDWYDYGYRNYDAQIGRFPQLDPLTDDYPELTPYQYAGDEPIANVDVDGLEPLPTVTVTAYISRSATQGANLTSAGLRAAITASNAVTRIGLDGLNVNKNQFKPANSAFSSQSSFLSPATEPLSFMDKQKHEEFRRQQYLKEGLNADGSKSPLIKLADNKTFERFSDNLVFPIMNIGSFLIGTGEAIQGIKMAGTETVNGAAFLEDVANLNPTHYLTRSKSQMQELINDIKVNGIRESIEYVEFNGQKYIVGGNHRYFAAQRLGIRQVPVKKVQLPFAGYKTPQDLMLEGKMPGYWKFLK